MKRIYPICFIVS